MTTTGARAVADAIHGHLEKRLEEENPIQVSVVSPGANWLTMMVQVTVGGVESSQPFSPDYTPEIGDIAWLRGPSGAKLVTDKVGGQSSEKVLAADLTKAQGDLSASGNLSAYGSMAAYGGSLYARDGVSTIGGTTTGSLVCTGDASVNGILDCDSQVKCSSVYSTGFGSFSSVSSSGAASFGSVSSNGAGQFGTVQAGT